MDFKLIIAGICTLLGLALFFKPVLENWLQKLPSVGDLTPQMPQMPKVTTPSSLNKELDSLKVLVDGVQSDEEKAFLVDKVGVSLLRKHLNKQ